MTPAADHDAYIAAAPEKFRASLADLRAHLAAVLPDAEEIIAYTMPGFTVNGVVVASYAAFSRQCGLYLQPEAIARYADEIAAAGFKATKTGITFTPRTPIPLPLIERLVLASRESAKA